MMEVVEESSNSPTHLDRTAVAANEVTPDDLAFGVVAAFRQQSGRNADNNASGVSPENEVTQSTEAKPSSTRIRLSTSFTGRPLPLSRSADASSLTATTRRSAKAARLVQVAHMTGMQDVETSVEDDLVTPAARRQR